MAQGTTTSIDDEQLSATIGAATRRARKEQGLTQEDASERMGISSEFYARIERGHALPSVPTFYKIVSALGVSASELLGLTDMDGSPPGDPAWAAAMGEPGDERPEVKRIMKRLKNGSRAKVRLIAMLVREMEERGDDDDDDDDDD